MTTDISFTLDMIEVMENFIEKERPSENIRHLVDLSYKIEDQSIIIFELRPHVIKPEEKIESRVAKTTFIKSKNHWKVFWLRANLKWENYKPKPIVRDLKEFIKLVEEDKLGCFWG
jgi:hypothetical protein